MTSDQFERHIADLFEKQGYETKLTPKAYDFGVDIIASNGSERIAIQVKMYETRAVNYKEIMYLYAGKDYYDCDKGILITACPCDPFAIQVAIKLEIEIIEDVTFLNRQPKLIKTYTSPKTNNRDVVLTQDFDDIWARYIKPLKGQTIYTVSGQENKIVDVTNDYLQRRSSNNRVSKIEKSIFKTIYYRLKERKSITRDEINTEFVGRGSSIITAVLGRLPFVTLIEKPKATLVMKSLR